MQVTYTQHAYKDMRYSSLERIKENQECALLCSSAPGTNGYYEREGYAHIGTATVTIELHSEDKILQSQIAALKAQLEAVRADAQVKENAILLQISKLQAITFEA
jgi:hypothetical protein